MTGHRRWKDVAAEIGEPTQSEVLSYVRGYILAIDDVISDLERTRAEAERTLATLTRLQDKASE